MGDICELIGDVVRANKKATVMVVLFVLLEIILLAPPYGSLVPMAAGFALMLVVAVAILNRYIWIRMFRPMLQLAGMPPVKRGTGECCCCCLCRKQDNRQVRALRALFVFVLVGIYAITLSAVALEQLVGTTNGRDPHPWMYFSFQFAGGFVLLIVSAWFVDIFIMTFRVVRYLWGRFTKKGDQAAAAAAASTGQQKFALPLLAFPLMWLVVFVILVTVASVQGSRDPVTRTVEVPLANLPACLDGYSLAMVSDLHAGPTVGKSEMSRHVEAINALGADAIVMVGDLVDDQVEDIGSIVDPISGFSAPDGQFFAYGNHEEYTGQARKWGDFVADRGFTVLNDTRITLPPGAETASTSNNEGCFFYLAGVNDYESDPQYGPALDGRDDSVATVLLAHEPIQVKEASKYSSVGLQLSGHTHGGQVFPYHVLAYLNQGYVSGLHKKRDTFLYVSEGAVGWGPRMRLLSTTEYTLVILRSPELFSNADTSDTESTRATGAAGVLLLLSILYCLGYPVVRAFRRAKRGQEDPEGREEWRSSAAAVAAGDYAT
ncbi:unnamed protein product [Ectocarpus sp. 12 AP-2014]